MLTVPDLLKAANQFFPNNYGVLLTGSQQFNAVFKKENDIDLVILDTVSSNDWSIIAEKDGYKIEFIILPVSDIDNLLDNQLFEPKNGLLSLIQGKILSNPFNVIEPLLNKTKDYFECVQLKTKSEYDRYLTELMKLRKLFTMHLSDAEKVFLLSDFVSISSLLETIRITRWSSKTKHKLRSLKKDAQPFMEKIASLFREGLENNFDGITTYINFYVNNYISNRLPGLHTYNQLVIDIGYPDFSVSQFANKLLPKIIESDNLAAAYQYFYLSPLKYTRKYKHNICLVFSISNEEQCLHLLNILHPVLDAIDVPNLHYNYFNEADQQGALTVKINTLKAAICEVVTKLIKDDDDLDSEKIVRIFSNLLFYVKVCFGINDIEFQQINSFIGQKWLFSKEEQAQMRGYPELVHRKNHNLNMAEQFYKKIMPELLQLVLNDKYYIAGSNQELCTVFDTIESVYDEKNDFAIPANDVNEAIFKATGFADIKQIWLYKLTVESVLLVLNINDSLKFNSLYSCSKAIAELGAEPVNPPALQN